MECLANPLASVIGVHRASWPKPAPYQINHVRKALLKDCMLITGLVLTTRYLSKELDPIHDMPEVYSVRFFLSLIMAVAMVFMMLVDLVGTPEVTRENSKFGAIAVIGHAGYFTVQTLFMQTSFHVLTLYAIVAGDARLMTALYTMATWVDTQGIALTLLFYKLNWTEPKWRANVLEPMEKEYPGFRIIMLTTHVPSIIVAVLDLLMLRDSVLVAQHGMTYRSLALCAVFYPACYITFAKLMQYVFQPGTLIYPFIKDLDNLFKCAAFVVVVSIAISVIGYGAMWLATVDLL